MKKLVLVGLAAMSGFVFAQTPPALPIGSSVPNPFTGPAHPGLVIDPALFNQKPPKAEQTGAVDRLSLSLDAQLPADVRTLLDNMVLVGRTDEYAILGFQMQNAAAATVGSGRALRALTIRHGGTFYLANYKVKLELDADSTGVFIKEPRAGGATIWSVDIENQRTSYVPQTMNDTPGSAGFGIGMRPATAAMGSSSPTGGAGGFGQAGSPTTPR